MKSTSSKTLYQLILLLITFTISILLLVYLHLVFLDLVKNLDEKTQNMKAKIQIGEYLVQDIHKIRSDFYELATTATNFKSRQIVQNRINKRINTIKHSLEVLQKGGTLKRVIRLNIVGHDDTKKIIIYKKNDDSISLESIDLLPKLIQLENMIKKVVSLLKKQDENRLNLNGEEFMKINKEIKRFYKKTPSFFIRITENANRLLYEGSKELITLKKTIQSQKKQYTNLELFLIFGTLLFVFVLGFIIAMQINKNAKKLERQEKSTRGILDAQENIVVVSNGEYMIDANKALVDFFDDYSSFKEFSRKHICICDFFENINNEEYIIDKDYDGLKWFEYIIKNSNKVHKVAMYKGEELNQFTINATKKYLDNNTFIVIVTLNNISKVISIQKKLKQLNDNLEDIVDEKTIELKRLNETLEQKIKIEVEKNREKDKTLIQQSRFAAMGEMIANIAHQWRQPLSAISSTSTAMKLQMQLNLASKEDIIKSYDSIFKYVDFLNTTIEDFRNFFKKDKEKVEFDILETIQNSISITNASYKDNGIDIILEFSQDEFKTKGFPSELSQVILNILNNSKDVLQNIQDENKLVLIDVYKKENQNIIKIYDNAGGIKENILPKIFDPYFTTKHKAQGTGIGLYMSKEIIEKNMEGSLSAKNSTFFVKDKKEFGACFTIKLPNI